MFNKNKTKDSEKNDISAKIRTMKDDIMGASNESIAEQATASSSSNNLKNDSPFLGTNNQVKHEENKPKLVPMPAPDPKPEPMPAPEPILPPTPKPEPTPAPAPIPEPAPEPISVPKQIPISEQAPVSNNFFPKIESEIKSSSPESTPTNNNFFPRIEPKQDVVAIASVHKPETKTVTQNTGLFRKDELTEMEGFDDLNEYETGGGGFFAYIMFFLLILFVGGVGYYILIIKEGELPKDFTLDEIVTYIQTEKKTISQIISEKNAEADNATGGEFSEKTNFLIVKDGELTKEGLKNLINKKFAEIQSYQGEQLEFLLVDENNTPIKFTKFAQALGLNLNMDILSGLNESFSIFLTKENGNNRIGIAVSLKNVDNIKTYLKNDEVNLFKNLNPILLDEKVPSPVKNIFADANYRDINIRYMNLNSKPDLSIDYFIINNYLVFATSKESGRLVIDKLSAESME